MRKPIDATHKNENGIYFKFDSYNVYEWNKKTWRWCAYYYDLDELDLIEI